MNLGSISGQGSGEKMATDGFLHNVWIIRGESGILISWHVTLGKILLHVEEENMIHDYEAPTDSISDNVSAHSHITIFKLHIFKEHN